MTWDYTRDVDPEKGPTDQVVWARLRHRRNQLLAATDFRVLPDAPWDTAPWVVYRQVLRDLTENVKDPRTVTWPQEPA